SDVLELIERRDTIQVWLARLDEQKGKVSERVLVRVRDDYQSRLRETLDALAGHRRVIQEELDRATRRLAEAEEEHQAAVDRLEEMRLRHLIGEIDQDTWSKRETELTAAVETASARETEIRAETRRLTELLDQLDERQPAATADVTLTDPPFYAAEEAAGDFGDDEDLYLDDENDALVAPAAAASTAPGVDPADDPLADTAPKPGLKCAECGYTNDLSAWFCGV